MLHLDNQFEKRNWVTQTRVENKRSRTKNRKNVN